MIRFSFELQLDDEELSPFEMGDIEVISSDSIISSKNRLPSQSMMLFPSLVDLLDLIKKILINQPNKSSIFYGIDSSFYLSIILKEDFISINNNNSTIEENATIFANQIYKDVKKFYSIYSYKLENENNYDDLGSSLADFRSFLSSKNLL